MPLDTELICDYAARTGRLVTVEDNVRRGGFGSAVLEELSREGLTGVKTKILGLPERFLEHGTQKILRKVGKIDETAITQAAMRLMEDA